MRVTPTDVPTHDLCQLPCGCVLRATDDWEDANDIDGASLLLKIARFFELVQSCGRESNWQSGGQFLPGPCYVMPRERQERLVKIGTKHNEQLLEWDSFISVLVDSFAPTEPRL